MKLYDFKDKSILTTALTHSSYANEHRNEGVACNERLEFLGDSILGFVIASYLYERFPNMPEGRLSKLRSAVVCEAMLSKKAKELQLNKLLRLGRGEENTGGRERTSIMEDAMEAVIGAIYLDGGLEEARRFILDLLKDEVDKVVSSRSVLDTKTALQELLQRNGTTSITYKIISESGPAHNKLFVSEVCCNNRILGKGTGRSKKEAEQAAAGEAIELLKNENNK
jgi:ribonuclease-3